MNMQNKHYKAVMDEVERLEKTGRYSLVKNFIQHGKTTVYAHCIDVALTACELAETYNFDVDYSAMITGALLHDYFLYDWHIPQKHFGLHGFTHPYTAANNAKEDYHIGPIEEDIIVHHMRNSHKSSCILEKSLSALGFAKIHQKSKKHLAMEKWPW